MGVSFLRRSTKIVQQILKHIFTGIGLFGNERSCEHIKKQTGINPKDTRDIGDTFIAAVQVGSFTHLKK